LRQRQVPPLEIKRGKSCGNWRCENGGKRRAPLSEILRNRQKYLASQRGRERRPKKESTESVKYRTSVAINRKEVRLAKKRSSRGMVGGGGGRERPRRLQEEANGAKTRKNGEEEA